MWTVVAALCLSLAACALPARPDVPVVLPTPTNTPAAAPDEALGGDPTETPGAGEAPGPVHLVKDAPSVPMLSMRRSIGGDAVSMEYTIGSGSYTTVGGREMPYQLRGVMAVPSGEGTHPLVLILHGAHEEEDESKRFDTGFGYLVKALVDEGFVAVSIDVAMPYMQRYGGNDDYIEKMAAIVNGHMEGLMAANAGEPLFPSDLTGKIDMQKVGMLGHSRSGAAIFQLASEQIGKGIGVNALLSLAPAADLWVEFPENIPVAFLVPQYDGDVVQLDGIYLYDYMGGKVSGDHSATVLMGANHNFFNRNLTRDDSIADEVKDAYPALTREEQETYLADFAHAFFASTLDGRSGMDFYAMDADISAMFGRDVNRQVRLKGTTDLIDAASAGGFAAVGAQVRHVSDSVFFQQDEVLLNTVTTSILQTIVDGTRDKEADIEYVAFDRDLIRIEWEREGASVSVTPAISDFSQKKAMTLSLVVDAASELNRPGAPLPLTVTLRDAAGNEIGVAAAPDQNALRRYPGEVRKTQLTDDFAVAYYEPTTPLGMWVIPLSLFEGMDTSSVQSMELSFGESGSGALYLAAWQLQ